LADGGRRMVGAADADHFSGTCVSARLPIAIALSVWIRAAPPPGYGCRAPALVTHSLIQLFAMTTSTSIGTRVIEVCPACVRIVSRRTATSWAGVSGASSTISSCTVAMTRAPVSFKAASNYPSTCIRMSALVPCTGVFKRSVGGGCWHHRRRRPLRVWDSYARRCLTFACQNDTYGYALKNRSPKPRLVRASVTVCCSSVRSAPMVSAPSMDTRSCGTTRQEERQLRSAVPSASVCDRV